MTISDVLNDGESRERLRERLAILAHEQWQGWMRFLFTQGRELNDGAFMIFSTPAERWKRQTLASYGELSDHEQLSDQAEADRVLAVLDELAEVRDP